MPSEQTYFNRAFFRFLEDLKKNNQREWFQANKQRYEDEVRHPAQQFISDFGPQLHKISRHFLADPRASGGSMFRIYRDTRFAKDKSPYKTHVGIQFRHKQGKDVHAPGFYLHLESWRLLRRSRDLASRRRLPVRNPRRHCRAARALETDYTIEAVYRDAGVGRRLSEASTQGLRPRRPHDRRSQAEGLHRCCQLRREDRGRSRLLDGVLETLPKGQLPGRVSVRSRRCTLLSLTRTSRNRTAYRRVQML